MIAKFWLHDHIYNIIWFTGLNFVYNAIDKNYDAITVIWKYLYFNLAVQSFMIVVYMYQVLGPPIREQSRKGPSWIKLVAMKMQLYISE